MGLRSSWFSRFLLSLPQEINEFVIFWSFTLFSGGKQGQTTQKQVPVGEIGPRIRFSTFQSDYSPISIRKAYFLIFFESSPDLKNHDFLYILML